MKRVILSLFIVLLLLSGCSFENEINASKEKDKHE